MRYYFNHHYEELWEKGKLQGMDKGLYHASCSPDMALFVQCNLANYTLHELNGTKFICNN